MPACAYSPLGPRLEPTWWRDHCYVIRICGVHLHIKRAQMPLSSAMLLCELDTHVDISENPFSSPRAASRQRFDRAPTSLVEAGVFVTMKHQPLPWVDLKFLLPQEQ